MGFGRWAVDVHPDQPQEIRSLRCHSPVRVSQQPFGTHERLVVRAAYTCHRFTFASAGSDNIKQWYLPDGKFIQNVPGHNAVINSVVVNPDGVFVSGGTHSSTPRTDSVFTADNGSLAFFDYKTGYKFQEMETVPQPGSLDSESGIFAMAYDRSWSRLITAEADKTIKVYKEDPSSVCSPLFTYVCLAHCLLRLRRRILSTGRSILCSRRRASRQG